MRNNGTQFSDEQSLASSGAYLLHRAIRHYFPLSWEDRLKRTAGYCIALPLDFYFLHFRISSGQSDAGWKEKKGRLEPSPHVLHVPPPPLKKECDPAYLLWGSFVRLSS
jgi:hypothetical protein